MFYKLFDIFEAPEMNRQFQHFFLMEPDVVPIQPFWVCFLSVFLSLSYSPVSFALVPF
jgi:hypothetical protein